MHDDLYEADGTTVREGQRVKVPLMLMDHGDEIIRCELSPRQRLWDDAWHRPGFRISTTRVAARDQIVSAYQQYDQAIAVAYQNPLDREGASRGSQLGDRDPEDDEQRSDGACPMCGGTGIRPGAKQTGWLVGELGEDDDDDDETQQRPRRATTRNEGAQRRHAHMTIDELRSHHADVMREIYEGTETDTELAQLWRHEK
jgi:hypothetical protein